jgi:hypothetical protein
MPEGLLLGINFPGLSEFLWFRLSFNRYASVIARIDIYGDINDPILKQYEFALFSIK